MNDGDYEKVLEVVTENADDIEANFPGMLREDEDKFHQILLGQVITEIDSKHGDLSYIEARELSEVCGEVENDMRHSDIRGTY